MFNGEPWNYLVHPKRLIGVDDVNGGMVFEKKIDDFGNFMDQKLLWGHLEILGTPIFRQEQQKIQARERAVERLEAAKKQAELAASSEDPEVPEPLGGDLEATGCWTRWTRWTRWTMEL